MVARGWGGRRRGQAQEKPGGRTEGREPAWILAGVLQGSRGRRSPPPDSVQATLAPSTWLLLVQSCCPQRESSKRVLEGLRPQGQEVKSTPELSVTPHRTERLLQGPRAAVQSAGRRGMDTASYTLR